MKESENCIPHLFRCPISLDLFTDPVTLSTGQTYDRPNILKWFSSGNLTCPVTMQKLHDSSLVPNHTLKQLIHQWLQISHQLDPDLSDFASLKAALESLHQSTFEQKLQTLKTIRILSEESSPSSRKTCLIQLGFFQLLLELIFQHPTQEKVVEFQESLDFVEQLLHCVTLLLPLAELGSLYILKEESKLVFFVGLLENGSSTIKRSLCKILEAISKSRETKELCETIGQVSGLARAVINLFHQNSLDSNAGIKAAASLCCLESNRAIWVGEGIVEGLVSYISKAEKCGKSCVSVAIAALEMVLESESGKESFVKNLSGVSVIVKMVFRVSDHEGSESAVNSLMIVCFDSLRVREEAIRAGVLSQLLLLLQSQCSGRTKTKGRMLLKLLRSKWDEEKMNM